MVGWIILDDTLVRKNKAVVIDLESDSEFTCVWKTSERNGAAIFVRKDWHARK